MTADFTKRAALAATAMGVVLTTPAFAQSASEGSAGDIVVTARRVEERLQDVPISISIFNQEQLTNRNVANSTDLAAYTPSLTVNSRYGPDKSSFAIRGFSQDLNTLPSVGVYFAEVVALWDRCDHNRPHNDPARDIAMVAEAPNAELFLAFEGRRLIGTIMTGHDAHRGWLYRLAVAPEHRGRGHGRALVGHAERWLAEQGLRKVQLTIRDGNAAARDFYVHIGYGTERRMVMSRWLDPAQRVRGTRDVETRVPADRTRREHDAEGEN